MIAGLTTVFGLGAYLLGVMQGAGGADEHLVPAGVWGSASSAI